MVIRGVLCGLALGLCGVLSAGAQMGSTAQPKIAPGTLVEPAKTLDAMLSDFEKEMMGVAKAMPAEKYGFVPTQAIFASSQKTEYTGVRSFAFMVGHVAQANYHFAAMASGLKVDTDMKTIGSMTDKESLVAALEQSFAFSHKAIATITEKNAFESVRESQTRATAAAGIVAHGFDHYGQMVEYLRMNGMVPPASAK